MLPKEFEGQNVVFAKDQPEYMPLPAYKSKEGVVITCWGLSWKERLKVLFTGQIKKRGRFMRAKNDFNLPVPRLEIRATKPTRKYYGDTHNWDYFLVYKHLLGHIVKTRLGRTYVNGKIFYKEGEINTPFREGAHIKNEMKQLKLRGFYIAGEVVKEIDKKGDLIDFKGV